MNRRSFINALAALIAAPRALLTRRRSVPPLTPDELTWEFSRPLNPAPARELLDELPSVTGVLEPWPPGVIGRKLYIDGAFVADIPQGATGVIHDERGLRFTYPSGLEDAQV